MNIFEKLSDSGDLSPRCNADASLAKRDDIDMASPPAASVAKELSTIVNEIDAFLTTFCSKLSMVVDRASVPLSNDPTMTNNEGSQEFDANSPSDSESDSELIAKQHRREQVEMLEEAWLRLEAEQRNCLQLKESLELASKHVQSNRSKQAPQAAPGKLSQSMNSNLSANDFEKLRQEITMNRQQLTRNKA